MSETGGVVLLKHRCALCASGHAQCAARLQGLASTGVISEMGGVVLLCALCASGYALCPARLQGHATTGLMSEMGGLDAM